MQVWIHLKRFTGDSAIPCSLDSIVQYLVPKAHRRSIRCVISKLIFAAACYFIWQERNNRIFKNQKRSEAQVIDVIMTTVRFKLLSCSFKKTTNVEVLLDLWKLPKSLIRSTH